MFQFQSLKATESFKIAATGNGGLLEQKKKKSKQERNVAGESRDSSRMWNVPKRSMVFYPKAES